MYLGKKNPINSLQPKNIPLQTPWNHHPIWGREIPFTNNGLFGSFFLVEWPIPSVGPRLHRWITFLKVAFDGVMGHQYWVWYVPPMSLILLMATRNPARKPSGIYIYYMGVSKNRGTPKWLIWGYHYFWKHPYQLVDFFHQPYAQTCVYARSALIYLGGYLSYCEVRLEFPEVFLLTKTHPLNRAIPRSQSDPP